MLMSDNSCTLSFAEERQRFCKPCLQASCRTLSSPASPPVVVPEEMSDMVGLNCGFCHGPCCNVEEQHAPSSFEDALPVPGGSCPTPRFCAAFHAACTACSPGSPCWEGATGNVVGEITRVALGTEMSPKPQPSSLPSLAGREVGCTPYFGAQPPGWMF